MNACWITLIVIAVIVFFFIIFLLYSKFTIVRDESATCLVGKTTMVTGANTGMGFYIAQDFAKRGARVILACRNPKRAEEAKTKIIEATGNQNVVVRIVDLASLASIRRFAVKIKATEDRLNILVNNAGVGGLQHSYTSDGLSVGMHINYFGPFLLTILLLDLLKRSAPSRIVNVSSRMAFLGKLNINDLNAPASSFFPEHMITYANAKLCNIIFTNELARRLRGSGVYANSVHPGSTKTEFFENYSGVTRIILTVRATLYKTAEEGAQTSIYLAVSKDIHGISGEYFSDCKKKRMPKAARYGDFARKLWEKSEEFVKLTAKEKHLL